MKILVRLPNWLGDMVMSIGFINALSHVYPGAAISVISKKGIEGLLEYFPPLSEAFTFSKEQYPGVSGAWKFGRTIRKKEKHDLFFSLPDSFSAALMGFASGAKKRIGFRKELRTVFLTDSFTRPAELHRVDEYINLLEQYSGQTIEKSAILFNFSHLHRKEQLIVNINSEASSRRLPAAKAISLLSLLRERSDLPLILVGGPNDAHFTGEVFRNLPDKTNIINLAGKTSLKELVHLMASSLAVLTTDSGPAHLANATGTNTVVLFGAGNEKHTAPYNIANRNIIRLGQLPCEPCVKNVCLLYSIPKCLDMLDENRIVDTLLTSMNRM